MKIFGKGDWLYLSTFWRLKRHFRVKCFNDNSPFNGYWIMFSRIKRRLVDEKAINMYSKMCSVPFPKKFWRLNGILDKNVWSTPTHVWGLYLKGSFFNIITVMLKSLNTLFSETPYISYFLYEFDNSYITLSILKSKQSFLKVFLFLIISIQFWFFNNFLL